MISNTICKLCGSHNVSIKEIELRHINSSMKMTETHRLTELKCRDCDWTDSLESAPMMANSP